GAVFHGEDHDVLVGPGRRRGGATRAGRPGIGTRITGVGCGGVAGVGRGGIAGVGRGGIAGVGRGGVAAVGCGGVAGIGRGGVAGIRWARIGGAHAAVLWTTRARLAVLTDAIAANLANRPRLLTQVVCRAVVGVRGARDAHQ